MVWASSCAPTSVGKAKLAGGSDQHLRELLAIRLAWASSCWNVQQIQNGQQSRRRIKLLLPCVANGNYHQARLRQAEMPC